MRRSLFAACCAGISSASTAKGLSSGRQPVALRPGESVRQKTLDLAGPMAKHGRDNLYLRIALEIGGVRVSEDTVFLAPPRFLALPKAKTAVAIKMLSPNAGFPQL